MADNEEAITVTFYCEREIFAKLEKLAEKEKRTRSNLINVLLDEAIKKR